VVTRARQIGYRLAGARLDYLLHTRPVEWPIVAAHTVVGYILAVGLDNSLRSGRLGAALLGILLWVVFLNGGTLALNSAFDRDEGDIAYLRNPPPPPRLLAQFGFGLMLLGLAAAFLLPPPYRAVYALCLLLSILYSVPPVRLKAVPGADWLINMWGFGTLTPYAGWAATGLPVGLVGGLILLAFCPLFAALYPLTQLYQIEEDTRRGDRTLVRWLGMGRSLVIALAAAILSFALFTLAAIRSEWAGQEQWRWLVLVLAAAAWAAVLIPWLLRWRSMSPRDHQHGMYRALFAWALTDIAVVLAWAT
jgi:4-hydroxybenzoate polyprenyltransferase